MDRSDLRISQVTKDLSPVYLINENSPNVLTVHGTSDRWVPYDQALLLDEKLGDKHKLLTIEVASPSDSGGSKTI